MPDDELSPRPLRPRSPDLDEGRLSRLRPVVEKWALWDYRQGDEAVVHRIESALPGYGLNEVRDLMKHYEQVCNVAKMIARGDNGKTIAHTLKTSQASVSKMRREAVELKVLRTEVNDGVIPAVRGIRGDLGDELRERLPVAVTVFHTPERDKDEGEAQYWKRRIQTFAECAAPLIGERLLTSSQVGISWGTTLECLIDAICRHQKSRRRTEPLTVIPMAGEMVGSDAVESRSCSALADKLGSAFKGQSNVLSLRGIPSFISTQTADGDAKAVRAYFQALDAFRNVAELSGTLDTILTSVGTHHQPNKLYMAELKQSGVDTKALQALCCGDIGGVLLEAAGLNDAQRSEFVKISERWLGMSEKIYRACAARADRSNRPGVIVIAIASNKAHILRTCIEQHLITECFIDADLAEELKSSLPRRDEIIRV